MEALFARFAPGLRGALLADGLDDAGIISKAFKPGSAARDLEA